MPDNAVVRAKELIMFYSDTISLFYVAPISPNQYLDDIAKKIILRLADHSIYLDYRWLTEITCIYSLDKLGITTKEYVKNNIRSINSNTLFDSAAVFVSRWDSQFSKSYSIDTNILIAKKILIAEGLLRLLDSSSNPNDTTPMWIIVESLGTINDEVAKKYPSLT
jgi:hypothetical protein